MISFLLGRYIFIVKNKRINVLSKILGLCYYHIISNSKFRTSSENQWNNLFLNFKDIIYISCMTFKIVKNTIEINFKMFMAL